LIGCLWLLVAAVLIALVGVAAVGVAAPPLVKKILEMARSVLM
jgi:hypothetical protein